ncbi:MAG TPA: hypothetical protein VEC60_18310, partial [Reyranella sp.]|nr:hypothetical protein [Reyranella sp.]
PAFFAEMTRGWLSGGPFPALGLAALAVAQDGTVASEGLAFFIGQEVAIQSDAAASPNDLAKRAVRLIDRMVEAGPIGKPTRLTGPTGETLLATPSADGGVLSVSPAK